MPGVQRLSTRVLHSLGRYFKTDVAYMASGGFWLFAGQAVAFVASIALAIAFANLVEPEKYGNYKYVLAIAGVLGSCTLTGLVTAVTRGTAHGHEGTLVYAFRAMLLGSVGIVLGGAALALYYFLSGNQFLGYSFLLLGALLPVITSAGLYRAYLLGKKNFRLAALFGILHGSLPSLAVLLGIWYSLPILALVAIYFGTSAVLIYFLYTRVKRIVPKDGTVDPVAYHLGKHLSIMGMLGIIADKLDSILVFQYLGGAELAMFALATALPDTLRGSLKNLTSLVLPKFAHKTRDQLKTIIRDRTPLFMAGVIALSISYIALAPWIFKTFFPLYQAAVPLSQVYVLIVPFSLVLSSAYFDVQSIVKERYILTAIEIVSQLIFTIVGLIFWGLWGVVIARVLARAVKAGATQVVIWRS